MVLHVWNVRNEMCSFCITSCDPVAPIVPVLMAAGMLAVGHLSSFFFSGGRSGTLRVVFPVVFRRRATSGRFHFSGTAAFFLSCGRGWFSCIPIRRRSVWPVCRGDTRKGYRYPSIVLHRFSGRLRIRLNFPTCRIFQSGRLLLQVRR